MEQALGAIFLLITNIISLAIAGGMFLLYGVGFILVIGIFVFMMVTQCLVYKKIGLPWWSALVPGYNIYVLLEELNMDKTITIVTVICMFIPGVSMVATVFIFMAHYKLIKRMGFSEGMFILDILLTPVMWGIMALGKCKYDPSIE